MTGKKQSGAAIGSAPLSEEYTLLNGRVVRLVMPDLFAMANGKVDMPNEAQASIYRLLYGSDEPPTPTQQFVNDQRYMRSLFYTAQLVIEPRVRLEADEEGEIDPRELALSDLLVCFSFLRYGPRKAVSAAADQDAGEGAATPPTGDDVPPLTE